MPEKRVVVIGSGPGGSAFASLMAHAGHQVTLLEKNGFPGGKCSSLSSRGYVVDTGVHMFGRGQLGPFGDITRILGEGPAWSATSPSFTLSLPGGGKLAMGSSQVHPISLFSSIKGRLRGWQNMRWPSTAVKATRELGLGGLLSLGKRFNDKRYPLYGELQDVSVRDFFTRLSESDDFLQTFHTMAMLTMVLPWQRASMGEFAYILASTMRASQLCYPRGGSGAIPGSFLRALTTRGGELRLGCEVAASRARKARYAASPPRKANLSRRTWSSAARGCSAPSSWRDARPSHRNTSTGRTGCVIPRPSSRLNTSSTARYPP